jgi:anti-sigma28 factor (negative regulator of flagellin synthesis)
MVSIQGLGGVPDPKPERTDRVRNGRDQEVNRGAAASGSASSEDGLTISSEAKAASEVARVVRLAQSQDDIRADRIAAARESLERGDYKKPEVVSQVADRLLKYFD